MRYWFYVLLCATLAVAGSPAPAVAITASTAGGGSVAAERFDVLIAAAIAAMLADPNLAIAKALEAERFAASLPVSTERSIMEANAQWLRGEACIRLNDLAAGRPIIAHALATASRIAPDSKLLADLLLSSGGIHTVDGNVAQALAEYQQAHSIYLKLGDFRSQSKALQSIGSLYGGGNDYDNALKYYGQALAAYKADPNLLLALYNNRGNALKGLRRFDAAEAEFRQALAIADEMKSPFLKVLVLCNIAEARLATGHLDAASRSIDEGQKLSIRGEAIAFRTKLSALSAQLAFQRHELGRARMLIDQRFAHEDLSKTTLIDREAHRTAYDVYSAIGRSDLALVHLAALKRIDDEATKLARSTNAALMGARFDFANQELKIAKLRQDELQRNIAFERASAQSQRDMFLGASAATMIVIAMLIFALFTSRRSRETVQAANADLAVTNSALGKALAAKTEFLATTSHEIRTPLNGILGMTQVMLADAKLPALTRDRITVVHGAGVTMRALVDDILDVAKMETGNLTIEAAPFDLKATIAESTRLWDDQAAAKGLGFVRELDDCPTMIEGDSARLRQIVFNLLSNALKFTAAGAVTLAIRPSGADRYRISVRDTGIGIAPDKCEEIFESFRQADAGTTRQFGGTGLGLAICRNLARAMGGEVSVESVAGEGATFIVDLPLVLVAVDPAAPAIATDDAPGLLIVDRNPITRAMLKTLLAPRAGRIEIAACADDAVACLDRATFARVLIDDATVRSNGDAPGDLRRIVTAAAVHDAAVSLLWPVAATSERDELLATGVSRVIAKPVSGADLVAAMFSELPKRFVDPRLVTQAA